MPLFWLSLAFLCGIVLASALPWSAAGWTVLGLLYLGLGLVWRRLRLRPLTLPMGLQPLARLAAQAPVPLFLLASTFFLGAARFQLAQPVLEPGFIAWHAAAEDSLAPLLEVQAVVDRLPDERDRYTNLILQSEGLRRPGEADFTPVRGRILARIPPDSSLRYGDRVIVRGALEQPPIDGSFSYRDYLARRGVHAYISWAEFEFVSAGQGSPVYAGIDALRRRGLVVLARLFPEPEASLLSGILLGVESGIPRPVSEAFKSTGTSHIIAISGFNMAIVAGLFASLFGRLLGNRSGAAAALVAISIYTILVGANAAVVRAAIMGGLALFARQVGRRQDGLNSLAAVAAGMCIFNPLFLWDVGFQLSFAATLGLVLYAQPLAGWFSGLAGRVIPMNRARQLAGPVGEYVLFTFAAQITTLPVLAYHFGRVSLVSLLANPLILPAQPAVMIVGGLALILGLVWLPLGMVASWFAWPFAAYTIRMVEAFAHFPVREIVLGDVALGLAALYYAALFAWTFARPRVEGLGRRLRPAAAFAVFGLVGMVVWRGALAVPDGRLHLVVLDVSTPTLSGEALLIQTPAGRHLLLNGGPSATLLANDLGRRLDLSSGMLDWVIIANPADAHIAALPRLVERFPAEQVLWAGPHHASRAAQTLSSEYTRLEVPILDAAPGMVLDLGDEARLEVLTAGRRGAVLLLEWGSFKAVLPVGASWDDFSALMRREDLCHASLLLLADGGYALTNPPDWIEWLQPQLVLLSVASGDRRGLPDAATLAALEGYTLLRTDRSGWIEITTDGQQMWVETAR
jgi:competence protein ComEC